MACGDRETSPPIIFRMLRLGQAYGWVRGVGFVATDSFGGSGSGEFSQLAARDAVNEWARVLVWFEFVA